MVKDTSVLKDNYDHWSVVFYLNLDNFFTNTLFQHNALIEQMGVYLHKIVGTHIEN